MLPVFVADNDGLLLFVVEAVPVFVFFGVRVPVPEFERDTDMECCGDSEPDVLPLSV